MLLPTATTVRRLGSPLPFVLAMMLSPAAFAETESAAAPQNPTTPSTPYFAPVVVSASGFEQKPADAPASISVIGQEDLQRTRYNNLAEALGDVEGVDISQGTGKTGGLNISIRGMPSAYTLILIDGRRQNPGGDISPNGFGETSTSFIPPMSAIERIEIIRGPMSTLYGSDAIGGVVNIITKPVASEWGTAVSVDQTFHENRDYGQTSNASVYASGPLIADQLGFAVRGRVFDRAASNLEFADGSTVSRRGVSAVEGRSYELGSRLTFAANATHELSADVEFGRQVYNNDNCQLGTLDTRAGNAVAGCTGEPNNIAGGYADEYRAERDQVALVHRAVLDFGTWNNSLTHRQTETIGRTIPGTIGVAYSGFPNIVAGNPRELKSTDLVFDTNMTLPVGLAHRFNVGAQYYDAEVKDGIASETFNRSSWALFLEDEWRLVDRLSLTLGARYEDHDAFGGNLSPRGYLVWTANDRWTLKGGLGRGYRTPSVNQLHEGINGATAQGAVITIGTPTLEPEISTNTEFGVYFDDLNGFDANITYYQTQFKDQISSGTPIPNCNATNNPNQPGCLDLGSGFTQDSFSQAVNIGEAKTRGIEVAARWQFAPEWRISGNYTYSDSEQRSGVDAGAPLTNTPDHMANARLDWEVTERLALRLSSEYYSERDRFSNLYENLTPANQAVIDGVGQLKGYSLLHFGGSFKASHGVAFTATVYNILDKDFLSGQTYTTNTGATAWASNYIQTAQAVTGTLQEGRRLWLAATFNF